MTVFSFHPSDKVQGQGAHAACSAPLGLALIRILSGGKGWLKSDRVC